jgi:hypothetical protein
MRVGRKHSYLSDCQISYQSDIFSDNPHLFTIRLRKSHHRISRICGMKLQTLRYKNKSALNAWF